MCRAQRRAHFQLAAHAGRRRAPLVERLAKAGRTDHHVGKIARLDIAQRIELPAPATHQTQARVLPAARRIRTPEAQRAVVVEPQPARLQFDRVAQRRNQPQLRRPTFIARAHTGGDTLRLGCGIEPLPPIPPPADHCKSLPQPRRECSGGFALAAIVDQRAGAQQAQVARPRAFQLDRAGHGARAERARPTAARHPHRRQSLGRERAERDIAEERIGHRHPVEQHQAAAGSVAAQRAQRHALRRRVGRTAVRTAKLLKPGHPRQHILDPARCRAGQRLAGQHGHVIGRSGGGLLQRLAGDDDRNQRCVATILSPSHDRHQHQR